MDSKDIKKANNYRKIDDEPQSMWNTCEYCDYVLCLSPYMRRCLFLNGGEIEDKQASVQLLTTCDKFLKKR